MSSKFLRVLAAALVVLLPVAAAAQAPQPNLAAADQQAPANQPPRGTINGVVRDSLGGAIPGATIRIVNESTNTALDVVSNEVGNYTASLAPGPYRVEVNLDGFETATSRITLGTNQTIAVDVTLVPTRISQTVVVTARRVEEQAQDVPIPLSVIGGAQLAESGAFNVNRLKEQLPSVTFYSTNPRNSSVQIRGLGAPFGLTNDGIEPGVGLYVDGVFYARPAAATMDFLDVDRIEVLRGPQGTLFGKNTTAGAINVTTRKPTFTPETDFEMNYGDYGFVQAKASFSGPLAPKLAGRVSFSGTQRDGFLVNTRSGDDVNDLNNLGVRAQALYAPSGDLAITVAVDHTRQRPKGYTQVVAGVAPTLRAANRQWAAIASDLHYTSPSNNAFDRLTDVDTPMRSYQYLGGSSVNLDWKLGPGRLTSTTAYRYWDWKPSNDRDFTGLPITTISAAPSYQSQWTQEVRYAGDLARRIGLVLGGFYFNQALDSDPSFKQEQGSAAARTLLAPTAAALTPGLLDGYGYNQYLRFRNSSSAVFGQLELKLTDRLRLLPGLRFNSDKKDVNFDQQIYGGLQTTDPALIALQLSILAPQKYATTTDDTNTSGQITAAYKATDRVNAYATYATGFKSVGLNLNGLPTDALGNPVLSTATVRPEDVHHVEVGVKTSPVRGVTANATFYDTEIKDFQTQVVNASVGVLRGYLANAEKARVRGFEVESTARAGAHVTAYGSVAYTDGIYVTFVDAPPPLEETGGPQTKDISGSVLPGVSKWATSFGGELTLPGSLLSRRGQFFAAADFSYRSSFSSSPSYSKYLVIPGYPLLNPRIGFRWADGVLLTLWARNVLNKDYYELLTAAPGNTGLIVGQPGDPRTFGVTMRVTFRSASGGARP